MKKKLDLDLKEIQRKIRSGEMKVKIAPQSKLEKYKVTAEEFFRDILKYNIHKCLVTDWSSITDFPTDQEIYKKRIKEKYGVVIPKGHGKHNIIVNILAKIEKKMKSDLKNLKKSPFIPTFQDSTGDG